MLDKPPMSELHVGSILCKMVRRTRTVCTLGNRTEAALQRNGGMSSSERACHVRACHEDLEEQAHPNTGTACEQTSYCEDFCTLGASPCSQAPWSALLSSCMPWNIPQGVRMEHLGIQWGRRGAEQRQPVGVVQRASTKGPAAPGKSRGGPVGIDRAAGNTAL
jgi:hypothetical protein